MEIERWKKLSKTQQMGAIAAEIMRAKVWEEKDKEKFGSAIERAISLIDITLGDSRWKKQLLMLLYLRAELAKFYLGRQKNIASLYAAL